MKKLLSILLLSILLFNWVGFRVVTAYLSSRATQNLLAQVETNGFQRDELLSIKIPSSLPYYAGSGEFEAVNGEIEFHAVQYNYVQRKITHDTIEYLCVPNKVKTAIKKASDAYFKLVNDIAQNNSSKKDQSGFVKFWKADYEITTFELPVAISTQLKNTLFCLIPKMYLSRSVDPLELPPNAVQA